MVKKKKEAQEIEATTEQVTIETTIDEEALRASLEEVKNCDGVIGYILRNTTSASIDLKDPARIIDYAILASTAFDAAEDIAEFFKLGEVKNITIKGKKAKMLSLTVAENKISIFMESNADLDRILKRIQTF